MYALIHVNDVVIVSIVIVLHINQVLTAVKGYCIFIYFSRIDH